MFQIYIFKHSGSWEKKKKNIRKANNLALGSYSLNKLKIKKIIMGCLYMSYYPPKKDVECTMSHILKDSSSIMIHLGYMTDCVHTQLLSPVRLFATPWTVAHQAPCPWNSPSENTGVGGNSLLQGIFLTQESNLGLLHCRQILYPLSHHGNPDWLIWKWTHTVFLGDQKKKKKLEAVKVASIN